MPGTVNFDGCMTCQTTTCNDLCTWGDPPPEPGTVSSADADGICEDCFCDNYTTCDTTCRDDYHMSARVRGDCGDIRCSPNCGYTFTTCEETCPTGYYIAGLSRGTACSRTGTSVNQRSCRMTFLDRIHVCDDECPPGYSRSGGGTSTTCAYTGQGYYTTCVR